MHHKGGAGLMFNRYCHLLQVLALMVVSPDGIPARFNREAQLACRRGADKPAFQDGQRVRVLVWHPVGIARVVVVSSGEEMLVPTSYLKAESDEEEAWQLF